MVRGGRGAYEAARSLATMIWGGEQKFTCPGRERLDAANPARENVFPGYKEGADVNLKVGLLRLGDTNFVRTKLTKVASK